MYGLGSSKAIMYELIKVLVQTSKGVTMNTMSLNSDMILAVNTAITNTLLNLCLHFYCYSLHRNSS